MYMNCLICNLNQPSHTHLSGSGGSRHRCTKFIDGNFLFCNSCVGIQTYDVVSTQAGKVHRNTVDILTHNLVVLFWF